MKSSPVQKGYPDYTPYQIRSGREFEATEELKSRSTCKTKESINTLGNPSEVTGTLSESAGLGL